MKYLSKTFIYVALIICGATMVIPFLWMVSTAFKSQLAVNKGNNGFIPLEKNSYYEGNKVKIVDTKENYTVINLFDENNKIKQSYLKVDSDKIETKTELSIHWDNFSKAFNKVPFARYFKNTIIVTILTVFGVLFTGSLAAFAFARLEFAGKDAIFYLFISMMMVPQPIYLIPSYVLLSKIGWINTYQALIVPWLANIFTIFLLRQQFKTIPKALFDSASIDGCNTFDMLWRIALPLSKNVLATAGVFAVISSWNSFMWPLVMTNSDEIRVLQVGLSYFSQESSSQTSLLMAATTFSILPLVVLFLFAQKQIIASVAHSGMKN